jgi:nucleoside-diphosphate-sugar epimerase
MFPNIKRNFMIDTIAITGATGFVGAVLTRRLAAAGRKIRALIRPGSAHKRPAGIDVRWIDGDLEDVGSLRRLVHGADAVVHCAGAVRAATRAQFNRVNVDGTARLVELAAEQHPTPNFLLISSLAAREPHLSPYAASKREGEKVLAEKSDKLFWTVFRPSAIYGPGDRELMPVFHWMKRGIAPILCSGNSRFSLLYVEDLAEAIVQWLDCECKPGCIYELHDGQPGGYSWHDVIDTAAHLRQGKSVVAIRIPLIVARLVSRLNLIGARAIGYAPMLTPGKIRELRHSNWVCDNTALNTATGWTPKILLTAGLQRTLRWSSSSGDYNCT